MRTSRLWILGTPLNESTFLSEDALELLCRSDLIVGESTKVARRWLSKRKELRDKKAYFLDGLRPAEERLLVTDLQRCAEQGLDAVLFSDGGMPILFDPGETVLHHCRRLGFTIRTLAGPTSWGTACAVSGWLPPFYIAGFPPRKTEERILYLKGLAPKKECLVLMDTPYRFQLLLEQMAETFPGSRETFLAWEIGTDAERYLWSNVDKITNACHREGLLKGEFVLVIGKG